MDLMTKLSKKGKLERITEELSKARRYLIILGVALITLLIVNIVLYNGIERVSSSATYLNNFNNLDSVKTWEKFKEEHGALNPSQVLSKEVSVSVNSMHWFEELLYPKTIVALHITIQTNFQSKIFFKLPSVLILLLDQKENIRGKLYIQYSSEDSALSGSQEAKYTYWFKVPSDMQGEKYSVIVEVFGVVDSGKSVNFWSLDRSISKKEDDIYGEIPYWYYEGWDTLRYLEFLAYDRTEARSPPPFLNYITNVSLAFTVAGVISAIYVLMWLVWSRIREFVKDKVPNLKIYLEFVMLFFFFFTLLLILITLAH